MTGKGVNSRQVMRQRAAGARGVAAAALVVVAGMLVGAQSVAQEASSSNFSMELSGFSAGGGQMSSSPSFSLTETLGEVVENGDAASANFSINGGFLNDIDLDNDGILGENDACQAEFAACSDADMDGCIDLPDTDGDSDGITPGMCDCDDANVAVWRVPGAVPDLALIHPGAAGLTTVSWGLPGDFGGSAMVYDLLRAGQPDGFLAASCLASETGDTFADEPSDPATGDVFFYLVRAVNGCPSGDGPVNNGTRGPRDLKTCP